MEAMWSSADPINNVRFNCKYCRSENGLGIAIRVISSFNATEISLIIRRRRRPGKHHPRIFKGLISLSADQSWTRNKWISINFHNWFLFSISQPILGVVTRQTTTTTLCSWYLKCRLHCHQ